MGLTFEKHKELGLPMLGRGDGAKTIGDLYPPRIINGKEYAVVAATRLSFNEINLCWGEFELKTTQ